MLLKLLLWKALEAKSFITLNSFYNTWLALQRWPRKCWLISTSSIPLFTSLMISNRKRL